MSQSFDCSRTRRAWSTRRIVVAVSAGVAALATGGVAVAVPSTTVPAPTTTLPLAAPAPITSELLSAVNVGLQLYAADVVLGDTDGVTCPMVTQERVVAVYAEQGVTVATGIWASGHEFAETLDANVVHCGVTPAEADATTSYSPQLEVFAIDGPEAFAAFAAGFQVTVAPSTIAGAEGDAAAGCFTRDAGGNVCVSVWHREGIVVALYLAGPLTDTMQAQNDAAFVVLLPEMIAGIGAYPQAPQ